MKIIRKSVEYQRETSLKNRNIYRTTDQTNRANSTPAIIIRLIVIILSSTGKQSNLISFPDYSCYTSLITELIPRQDSGRHSRTIRTSELIVA